MATAPQAVLLGGEELGGYRHLCALFDGPEDAATTLRPFVEDGLDRGDRVVHLVEDLAGYGARLTGRDIEAAMRSGQLDVREWNQTYLADGAFSRPRMLATLRSTLRESAALGYARTCLIGDMEWAPDDAATDRELVAYESEVDPLLRGTAATIVCAYDLGRHRAGRIAAVMAAHRAVFVDGRLQRADGPSPAPTARDRVLTAASTLFADRGVRATGVDALIASAGVAKATFYRHFPSKDDLIVAWLRDPRTRWFDRVRAEVEARSPSGEEVIPILFDIVAEWLEEDDVRGCPYLNTTIELNDPGHAATATIRAYLREIESYLQRAVAMAGHDDAAALGTALQTLLAGSITLAAAHHNSSFVLTARDAAVRLLGSGRA